MTADCDMFLAEDLPYLQKGIWPGARFGQWTVTEIGLTVHTRQRGCRVRCACDAEKVVDIYSLLKGQSTRCRACAAKARIIIQPGVGERRGFLVVIEKDLRLPPDEYNKTGTRAVRVRCDCGTEKLMSTVQWDSVLVSCGCRTGGTENISYHPLYDVWRTMMQPCYNRRHTRWINYGGQNIKVHEPWHDVGTFINWVAEHLGPRPAGLTPTGRSAFGLRRLDMTKDFEPGNVAWGPWEDVRLLHNRRTWNRKAAKAGKARKAA